MKIEDVFSLFKKFKKSPRPTILALVVAAGITVITMLAKDYSHELMTTLFRKNGKPIVVVVSGVQTETKQPDNPKESPNNTQISEGEFEYLSEEQIRGEIDKSLKLKNIKKAIKALDSLLQGEVRDEECGHVFKWCVANGQLEDAEEVTKLFYSPSKREEALKELALERIK